MVAKELSATNTPGVETNEQDGVRAITFAIKSADKDLRRRFPILNFQSAIGTCFFLLATSTVVASALLYLNGAIPWWVCLIISAICLSVIREIEHDLIHNLYFPKWPLLQNAMMLAVWPFLGNLPHPWYRRKMHLLHHRTSGHDEDFEERLIGNGMKFGPLKLLAMFEPGLASLFRKKEFAQIPFYNGREFARALFPVAIFYLAVWYGFLVLHTAAVTACFANVALPEVLASVLAVVDTIVIVWVLPNMLRQVCLQIISGNMHYFGDIDNRLQETQVMNAWWLAPLNLFTCNFGSTHSIHHFVVNQPFYLRQMVAGVAHAAFRKYGIRYNDAATILRGNRYSDAA